MRFNKTNKIEHDSILLHTGEALLNFKRKIAHVNKIIIKKKPHHLFYDAALGVQYSAT